MTQPLTSHCSETSFETPIRHRREQQASGHLLAADIVLSFTTVAAALAFIVIETLAIVSTDNSVTLGSVQRVPKAPLGQAVNGPASPYPISANGAGGGSVDATDVPTFDVKWGRSINQIARFARRPLVPPHAVAASEKPVAQQSAQNESMLLLAPDTRTAFYDIAAHSRH